MKRCNVKSAIVAGCIYEFNVVSSVHIKTEQNDPSNIRDIKISAYLKEHASIKMFSYRFETACKKFGKQKAINEETLFINQTRFSRLAYSKKNIVINSPHCTV